MATSKLENMLIFYVKAHSSPLKLRGSMKPDFRFPIRVRKNLIQVNRFFRKPIQMNSGDSLQTDLPLPIGPISLGLLEREIHAFKVWVPNTFQRCASSAR